MRPAVPLAVVFLTLGFASRLTAETAPMPRVAGSAYPHGAKMIEGYFRDQVKQIADRCLDDLTTKEAWEKKRPELRKQFLEMMGLWPMPPRTELKPVTTGTVDGEGFTVEKVQFHSMPGLYVTANVYRPKAGSGKLPAILYVCGHGNVVENGVSFGSKVFYQYHPAWFAAHGYVCIVPDTLQLSEIPGVHHGTYRLGMWWWQARGYTPGGVELWNAIRCLDYLETRPDVDAKRIGVTGRSGGGATTWWVLAADDRPVAFAPVAGIADLQAHVCEGQTERLKDGVIAGHCDCMYMVNSYRWDFPLVAALAAPRPLLLGNSDADDIFPVAGYRRIAEKVRKVYALYGAEGEGKFQLLETSGPHKDSPELRIGIDKWMNRWLKGDTTTPVADDLPPKLTPQQLKVLDRVPEGEINTTIHEFFVKPAVIERPSSAVVTRQWWENRRPELLKELQATVFSGWPTGPNQNDATVTDERTIDGVRLRAIDFTSERGIVLRLFVLTAADGGPPTKATLTVLDEPGWDTWVKGVGSAFGNWLQTDKPPARDEAAFARTRTALKEQKLALAFVAPRGVGPTKWAEAGSPTDLQYRRRFALLGQTLDGQRAWDVRRAVATLAAVDDLKALPVTLAGDGEAAGVALFAGLFEPSAVGFEPGVAGFDLWNLPTSYRTAPTFLNLAKVLDVPQAVALASPRPVVLHVKPADRAAWDWPLKVQEACGETGLRIVGE